MAYDSNSYAIIAAFRDSLLSYNAAQSQPLEGIYFMAGKHAPMALVNRGEVKLGAISIYEQNTQNRLVANNGQVWQETQMYGVQLFTRLVVANEYDINSEERYLAQKDLVKNWLYWLQTQLTGSNSIFVTTSERIISVRPVGIVAPNRANTYIDCNVTFECIRIYNRTIITGIGTMQVGSTFIVA